ncbi:hemophore-related protein [Nocardia aurantiaca]|uniref:Hemophore-related protein n=1 Tax=Nocardia aurantiaca TaxID=2675850 RepID=A0A6I3KLC2_9NOCA|nr:hemophore-related protein [Nocardia aurantiaca]MTE11383.1 hemophore-related protein [Nocardia aurantiaca]
MRLIGARYASAIAVTIAGFGAAVAVSGAGAAVADPMSDLEPLLSSTCSFDQIDAAFHRVEPATAAQLDAAPERKAPFRLAYDQPIPQRRIAFQALIVQQQLMGAPADINPDFIPLLRQVVDSCHQY